MQVLGHLVTYSILAYLIAALVVYFRLLPSARDRKDQLVSGSPVKQKSNNAPAGPFPALLGHALAHLHPQKVSHLVVPQVDKTFLKLFTFNYRVSQKNALSRHLESDLSEAACLQDDDYESAFFLGHPVKVLLPFRKVAKGDSKLATLRYDNLVYT